jgi:hypothetical protein
MSRRHLTLLAFLSFTIWSAGCQQSAPLERSAPASKGPGTSDLSKDPLVGDDEQEEDNIDTKKKKKKKTSVKKDNDEDEEDSDEDKDKEDKKEDETPEYPQLAFNGRGYTTYELKDHLGMTMGIETRLDESELTIDTKTAKVECGSKNGCKQNDVDASVNANSIGANVYQRTTASELKTLKKKGFNAAGYAIFAKSVRGKNGITYNFDKPIPVYPWPAAKTRYDALNGGSETWDATATADRNIPLRNYISLEDAAREHHERAGNARKTFSITMTVSKTAGASSGEVKITFDLTIAEDKDRMAYKYFPIPKTSTFTIDTSKRDVRGANMLNWSHGDKSKKAEESVLDYKLCTKTTTDDVKQFPCD